MREIVRPGITLFLVTLVAAVSLGFVHKITEGPIAAQKAAQSGDAALQKFIPSAVSFEEIPSDMFDRIDRFVVGSDGSADVGYIAATTVKGYGGDIELLVILNAEGQVDDFSLLSHAETPGLGSNAENPEFADKFRGKSGPFTVVTGAAGGENEIEAITSATITSSAVAQGVNRAVDAFSLYQDIAAGVVVPSAADPNASPWQKYMASATDFEEIDSSEFEEINTLVVAYENDKEIGYVANVTTKGFGGNIEFVVVLDEARQIVDIDVLEHEETPGLGSKVEEADFINKYVGKSGPFTVVTAASGDNDIDVIAGATVSTEAVNLGINKVVAAVSAHQGVELELPEAQEEEEPEEEADPDSLMESFFPAATRLDEVNGELTVAFADDQEIGYIVNIVTKGFGGDIELLVAVNPDRQVEDITFLNHNETPGLGSKAAEPDYIGQYQGKTGPFTLVASAGGASDIEAIAGATITCDAVTLAVNDALSIVASHLGAEPEEEPEIEETEEGTEEEEAEEEEQPAAASSSPMQKYVPTATSFEEVNPGVAGVGSFTIASANGQEVAYVAEVTTNGFAGPINLVVLLGQGGQIEDIVVVSHNETPGLGSRAEEPAYLNQYKGKSGSVAASDIDSIAGATVTGDAFVAGVNNALSAYQEVIVKGVR